MTYVRISCCQHQFEVYQLPPFNRAFSNSDSVLHRWIYRCFWLYKFDLDFPASITGNIVVTSLSTLIDQKGILAMLPTIVFFFIGGLTITLVLSAVKRSYNFNDHQLYQSGFCLQITLALYQLILGMNSLIFKAWK